jgi:multiple antibiotic resistance protein
MDHLFAIKFFGALFAIMNPIANLPVFLGLTAGADVAAQRRMAYQTTLYTVLLCVIVAVVGQQILDLFGIDIDSFRVAGGIVLGGIGWNMLNGEHSTSHSGTAAERKQQQSIENISFYPMAFPMLVGPGTIAAMLVFLHQANSVANYVAYAAVVGVVIAMIGVTLHFAGAIGAHLSQTLRVIMTRVMGMILLAIAVQMVGAGLVKLLPGLAGSVAAGGAVTLLELEPVAGIGDRHG